jgi:hypothetical protein
MVTDTVVTISEEMRTVGWFLLEKLKEANFPAESLFWSDFDEGDFRLFLVSSEVDDNGVRVAYEKLNKIFEKNSIDSEWGFSMSNVMIIGSQNQKFIEIRRNYKNISEDRKFVRRISLHSGEAYVYFLN